MMSRPFHILVDHNSNMPLAGQISQQLTRLIVGGTLQEGDELPAIQELADELGVNLHTVRAGYQRLESQGLVSLGRGRRARVLTYDRTRWLDSSSQIPSHAIGVIIPEFIQAYAPFLAAIEAEAAQESALVFVANAHDDRKTADFVLDRLLAQGVDGIVVVADLLESDLDLPDSRPPIVYVDAPGSPGTSIEFDLEHSQYLATSHLLQHGHNRIGYITPPIHLANVAPKLAGHSRALEEADIDPASQPITEVADFQIPSGRTAARELLEGEDSPTAITATSDELAVGTYQAARELGMRIPNDLAITSNDNSELSAIIDPGLTTVTLPLRQAGKLAVQSIRNFQNGTPGPERVTLNVELVIRNSCGCET